MTKIRSKVLLLAMLFVQHSFSIPLSRDEIRYCFSAVSDSTETMAIIYASVSDCHMCHLGIKNILSVLESRSIPVFIMLQTKSRSLLKKYIATYNIQATGELIDSLGQYSIALNISNTPCVFFVNRRGLVSPTYNLKSKYSEEDIVIEYDNIRTSNNISVIDQPWQRTRSKITFTDEGGVAAFIQPAFVGYLECIRRFVVYDSRMRNIYFYDYMGRHAQTISLDELVRDSRLSLGDYPFSSIVCHDDNTSISMFVNDELSEAKGKFILIIDTYKHSMKTLRIEDDKNSYDITGRIRYNKHMKEYIIPLSNRLQEVSPVNNKIAVIDSSGHVETISVPGVYRKPVPSFSSSVIVDFDNASSVYAYSKYDDTMYVYDFYWNYVLPVHLNRQNPVMQPYTDNEYHDTEKGMQWLDRQTTNYGIYQYKKHLYMNYTSYDNSERVTKKYLSCFDDGFKKYSEIEIDKLIIYIDDNGIAYTANPDSDGIVVDTYVLSRSADIP